MAISGLLPQRRLVSLPEALFSASSISLSLSIFLSSSLSLSSTFSSHRQPWKPYCDLGHRSNVDKHALTLEDKSTPRRMGLASLTVKCHLQPWGRRVTTTMVVELERRSPATSDQGSWFHEVQLNLLVVLVSLVRDESGRISKHAFRDKLSKL